MATVQIPLWKGYRPIPKGWGQSYHVRRHPRTRKWALCAKIGSRELYEVPEPGSDVQLAIDKSIRIANYYGIPPGGTLTVNEFKHVVKTLYVSGKYFNYFLGKMDCFKVDFRSNGVTYDNSNHRNLETGDEWPYQKVGIRYHYQPYKNDISMRHSVNYESGEFEKHISLKLACKEFPKFNPEYLMEKLKESGKIRGGSFYVNEHGLVFTPVQRPSRDWVYRYVCRLDLDEWLPISVVTDDYGRLSSR